MGKKRLDQCKSGKDFVNYASKKDDVILTNGKGSHMKVYRPKRGGTIVPRHNKDLPTGTRRAIMKAFVAMGITGFIYLLTSPYINHLLLQQLERMP